MSFSGNFLRVHDCKPEGVGSPSNNYIGDEFVAPFTVFDVWMEFDWRCNADLLTAVHADTYSGMGCALQGPAGNYEVLYLLEDGSDVRFYESALNNVVFGPALVADTTYAIKIHASSSYDGGTDTTTDAVDIWINGTLEFSDSFSYTGLGAARSVDIFKIGDYSGECTHPTAYADYDNLTLGSTDGGSDYWSDDFETGNATLANYTDSDSGYPDCLYVSGETAPPDFTLALSSDTFTFTVPAIEQADVLATWLNGDTETITLSVTGQPANVLAYTNTGTLDPGDDPPILFVQAQTGAVNGTYNLTLHGVGTLNSHDVPFTVVINGVPGNRAGVLPPEIYTSRIMLSPEVPGYTGGYASNGCVAWCNGELYAMWTEEWAEGAGPGGPLVSAGMSGPYVARWNGASWRQLGASPLEVDYGPPASPGDGVVGRRYAGHGLSDFYMRNGAIATDGENIFVAYTIEYITDHGPPLISQFIVRVWQWDGATWTDLGSIGGVDHTGDLVGVLGPVYLTAGPDEPGACYVAYAEYMEGSISVPDAAHFWFAGFGSSSFGSVDLNPGVIGYPWFCMTGSTIGPQLFYSFDGLSVEAYGTAGALASIPLAAFTPASDPDGRDLVQVLPRAVTNAVGDHRYLVTVAVSDTSVPSYGYTLYPRALRLAEGDPTTYSNVDVSYSGLNLVATTGGIGGRGIGADAEPDDQNVWFYSYDPGSADVAIQQLYRECTPHAWTDARITDINGGQAVPPVLNGDGLYCPLLDEVPFGSGFAPPHGFAASVFPICQNCVQCGFVNRLGGIYLNPRTLR